MENETTNLEMTEKNEESTVDSSAFINPIHTSVTIEKDVASVTNKDTNSSTKKKSKHRKRNLGYI